MKKIVIYIKDKRKPIIVICSDKMSTEFKQQLYNKEDEYIELGNIIINKMQIVAVEFIEKRKK